MDEEEKKKGRLDLDWEVLLPSRDAEPTPFLVVVPPSPLQTDGDDNPDKAQREVLGRKTDSELEEAINNPRRKFESVGPELSEKRRASLKLPQDEIDRRKTLEKDSSLMEEFTGKSDRELEEAITRLTSNVERLGPKLPDKGEKFRASLKRHEDERERRNRYRLEKADDGCEKLNQLKSPYVISASDSFREESPSSEQPSQSFTTLFCRKIEKNPTDVRTVIAFDKELSHLTGCDRRKMRLNGRFLPRERQRSARSLRQSSFQYCSNLSVDVDKHVSSDGDQNGVDCCTHSPSNIEEVSGSFSKKRKASEVLPSNGLRARKGQTVVLLDEDDSKLTESMEQTDKVDECMRKSKIYYPSSDDPESIEICFTDMECLAPEAFLSSTIMNFYIRHLQQLTSPTSDHSPSYVEPPVSPTCSRRSNYHFFNTYFYKKLKEAVLNKVGRESLFLKLRRWWKGVNIFHKAYILLPIHENLHWSLVIICIPDMEDESGPIILHLDSLGLHDSRPIFGNIKSFLKEEWNYLNQGEAPPDIPIVDRIWKNLPRRIEEKTMQVPQQRNDYDCGLFVLFFMERFIEEVPQRLKRKDLAMFHKNWFKPEDASSLRRKIRKLLEEEFQNATKENGSLDHKAWSSVGPLGGNR